MHKSETLSSIVDTKNKLFDEIDENERCDIIVSNLLFDDLFTSNDGLCITHLDSVSLQSSKGTQKRSSSNSGRQNNRELGSINSSRNSKRNRNNSLEEYPLHLACQNGQIEVVGKLLQEFSPVTLEHDLNRWSPLHHAAWHGHHRIVELLLRSKRFSVNAVDNSHMSPLHLAALGGRAEVVRILLDCPDINVHAKNKDGKTALDFCKQNPNRDWQLCTELIEKFLQKPLEKIKICLADGSTIELDLVSGPAETTVRQLHAQMMTRLRLPDVVSHVFGIWICSKSVRIQLNPDHKPVQFLLNWKRYASELTTVPNESSLRNPSLSSSPTLNSNSEDAQLWWSRDTLLKIEFEQRLRIPHVIHLLFLEAYQNYLLAYYPCTDEDAIEFAVLMMGINEKQLDDKLWEHFFHNDSNNLSLLIPAEKLKRAGAAYWRRTILKRYKEVFIDDQTMQNRPQLQLYLKMQFLNLAQNLTSYGSSFFTGEHEYRGRRTSVFICVNDVGVHLINRVTKLQEYSFSYQQMTFTFETEAQSTLEINVKDNKNVDHTRLLHSTNSINNKNFKNSIFSFSSSSNKQSNTIDRPLTSSSTSLSSTLTNNNEFQQRNHNRHILSHTLNQVNGQLLNLYQAQTSNASTSVSVNASSNQQSTLTKKRMFQVRRTFLLIVTFDVIFMVLLWIIYNQIKNITIDQAFVNEVIHYSIKTSLFDIVGLSAFRFILLMISYAILKWSHWSFVAFTTLGSTGFIIAKTCVFTISKTDKGFTDYGILIVSFILAWVEIWFFDYRVIPHERRLREALNHSERRPLLASNSSRSASPIPPSSNYHSITLLNEHRQSFYSPVPSVEGSDTEETDTGVVRTFRSDSNVSPSLLCTPASVIEDDDNDEDYEKLADDVVEKVWRIFKDNDSWLQEAISSNGLDIVLSKNYPKLGKVFRLSCIIPGCRDDAVQLLFEQQEDMSKWSPTVNDSRVLQVIKHDLYITYQMTNEQAQGIIAKRDFVNISTRRFIDDVAIIAAQACVYPQMPPKDNCVRGENGPTAYILEKHNDTSCKFTMILNVDLKGWLPQYLINSSLANVQLTLAESLRTYLSKAIDISSSGSSIGDITT
ncbi:unnamed protein product [Rotaria sp. Silwood1]|nr:unnamed protein product [Rotaria sp. Silwood1]CAF3361144.1 unnamed protein product [Rotaria sp. Silwood1]CAF3384737.1 unnamed protein product [Rotaria sp. Silwood1]CAF3396384.1 unnamed protein product [Rotaria sp. Silwood1]CAF4620533.1 unnamed protein product [Rotaria sp. Silwood1]